MTLLPTKYALIFLTINAFVGATMAQDTQKKKHEKEFNQFQNNITNDFNGYQSRNDSIFLKFLESSWKEFQLFKEDIRVRVKPVEQPVVGDLNWGAEEPPAKENIQGHQPVLQPEQEQPGEGAPGETLETTQPYDKTDYSSGIDFFGQWVDLPAGNDPPTVRNIATAEIIKYYKYYQINKSLAKSADAIAQFSKERSLNDWGCLYLLILASASYYPEMNNRVLFVWVSMLKRGFDVKIGHDGHNIYLLVNFEHRIFNKQYVSILTHRYYVYTFPRQAEPLTGINSYETDYPQALKPVSIMVNELPGLPGESFARKVFVSNETLSLSLTVPLIDYLNAYPDCDLGVYFIAPASEKVMKSMDKILLPVLTGKTETEKVSTILRFVQISIPYKTDEEQFGKENYLFADETMYYPYSDCEDRAILLSKLITRYTGLTTVGLDYPEHVSLGVKLTKPLQGDFVLFNGEKFYICDPTYIGAKIGMAMDFMKDHSPQIINASQKY